MTSSIEKQYDVFVSHASEDKDAIARPLADKLKDFGLNVWYDEFTLKIGDKLRESIDKGLRSSNFGIVILSKNFIAKNWPKLELEALVTLSMNNRSKILPIWHGLDMHDLLDFSPMLASIVALPSSLGIDVIASKIYEITSDKLTESKQDMDEQYGKESLLHKKLSEFQIKEIQNNRFQLILKLYQEWDRKKLGRDAITIGKELGFSEELTKEVVGYFKEKGLIQFTTTGSLIQITIPGIDYVENLIPDSDMVKKIRSYRFQILEELYNIRNSYWGTSIHELQNRLGLDEKTVNNLVHYLKSNYLVESPNLGPNVKITADGIDFIEQSDS